jgi:hypothetical protein
MNHETTLVLAPGPSPVSTHPVGRPHIYFPVHNVNTAGAQLVHSYGLQGAGFAVAVVILLVLAAIYGAQRARRTHRARQGEY